MFKHSTNYLFFSLMLASSAPTFADVHKWIDADGKIHYGDAPPIAGTGKVKTDKQTVDQIANGEQLRRTTAKVLTEEARQNERREQEREQARLADERKRRNEAYREEMRRRNPTDLGRAER